MTLNIFKQSVSDFFSRPIVIRLLGVLIVSSTLVYIFGYLLFDYLYNLAANIDGTRHSAKSVSVEIAQSLESIPVIGIAIAWIVANVVFILLTIVGVFAGSYIAIIFSLIIAGLLTPSIIKVIAHRRHISLDNIQSFDNIVSASVKVIVISILHLLAFILLLPIFLIPVVNIGAFTILLYSFFRFIIIYDVGSNMLSKDDYQKISSLWNQDILLITLIGFFLSSIPILGIFSSVFTVIMLVNFLLTTDLFDKENH